VGQLGLPSNKGEDGRKEKEEEEEEGKKEWMRWEAETGQYSDFVSTNAKESTVPLNANMSNRLTTAPSTSPEPIVCSIFEKLKQEHDLAKAAKLDNAEVPVELWDQAICKGPPSSDKKAALTTLMGYLLGRYQWQLWLEAWRYLKDQHGNDWPGQVQRGNLIAVEDATAVHNVLWWAAQNDWFEYPLGSRLIFFWFPTCYHDQAKRGVKIFYKCKGPSLRQRHLPLKSDEKEVLKKKIKKFIKKEHLAPPAGLIGSLIKYFAIPKGVLNNVIQDWRIVFHAATNKHNDCVWAPLLCLPTMNSLLCITDKGTMMRDQDLSEMFLLFHLHTDTVKFTGVDLGPLQLMAKECPHWWICWSRNLIGFKLSPYNSIKMYLISEEVIRRDRHNPKNAFQ
jgi:hypothetical protein